MKLRLLFRSILTNGGSSQQLKRNLLLQSLPTQGRLKPKWYVGCASFYSLIQYVCYPVLANTAPTASCPSLDSLMKEVQTVACYYGKLSISRMCCCISISLSLYTSPRHLPKLKTYTYGFGNNAIQNLSPKCATSS